MAAEYIWQLHCQDHDVYYDGTAYPALKTTDGTPPASVCPVNAPDTVDMPVKLLKIYGTEMAPTSVLDLSEGMFTLPQGTSFPASPALGDIFHRNDEDKVYCYDGAAWHEAGKGTAHADLSGITVDQHHNQSHVFAGTSGLGTDHTASGLTTGQTLRATGAAAAQFEAVPISRGGVVLVPTAAINVVVWRALFACTVTNVRGYRVGGTGATINARKNSSLSHLASALSLTSADEWLDGSTPQNTAYAVGDKMEIQIISLVGDPTQIAIQLDLTRP